MTWPVFAEVEAGEMMRPENVFLVIWIEMSPVTPSPVTRILALPRLRARTRPAASTVAMAGFSENQENEMSERGSPLAFRGVAVSRWLAPTARGAVREETSIRAMCGLLIVM